MIIRYPTALYSSVLETAPNVIFTISSTDPPVSNERVLQLPSAEEAKDLPKPVFYFPESEFVSNMTVKADVGAVSNRKQFEVGQLLNFDEFSDSPTLNDDVVPDSIDLLQDENTLDLSEYGLTKEEVAEIDAQSRGKFVDITNEINRLKEQILSNKSHITETQKQINEVRKIIDATLVAIGEGEIVEKLRVRKAELEVERDATIAETNVLTAQIAAQYDQLLKVREVVR